MAAQLADGDLKRRAGPQRRLFEQHPDVCPPERVRGRRMIRQAALRLQLRGQVEQPREAVGLEIENGEEVLGRRRRRGCRVHVRYSPLIRTYSAVRSQVQIVADSAPEPEAHVDLDRLALQMLGRPRRRIVMRQAVLEQQDAADVHGRAIDVERHAGASRRSDDASPVRIGAVHRGLHERRIGNGPRHLARGIDGARVRHGDGNQLRRALAAADDPERQLAGHGEEPLEQRRIGGLVDRPRRSRRTPGQTGSRSWSTRRRR